MIKYLTQISLGNTVNSLELPLDVSKELAQYSKIFVSKEIDFFRVVHCFENLL